MMIARKMSVAWLWIWAMNATLVSGQQPDPLPAEVQRAGNAQVAEIMRTYPGRGVMADDSRPTPAAEAVRQFRVRDGFQMQLVASEPEVEQPLFLSWDSRGRMWVVHYRQYQYPAGLKVIRFDQHLRAVFDKVPDPPPRGVPGSDRITVHTDTDGDGRYDQCQEVISGLNIATAVQVGNGAIWVLNPPYLLRYPDQDRNDVPDGDPEVHLTGFGLQDTHSVANSMTWGPDGWLYGCNGSTTVGDVSSAVTRGVRFEGQCVWRYHPTTKEFEIYAEGGGNNFSLEIDAAGRVFAGTNGGETRGWYFPQGSYSAKNWGKHGPLTNPHAFGFFQPMKFEGDGRRFPQAFCIYEGGLFPASFTGSIIAPNSLHNLVWHSRLIADGSTYRTEDEPNLVDSPDRWFRPVYSGVGPDGAVYLADWYDTRLSHVSPIDDWHKQSGRIYRLVPTHRQPRYEHGDLHVLSSEQLINKFTDPNKWVRQRAALELGWRNDKAVVTALVAVADEGSLEALWALNSMDALTLDRSRRWLSSDHPDLRRWVIRLLGDRHQGMVEFASLAATEPAVQVRSQLASTAKRIPAEFAIPVIESLILRDEDSHDPHLPLLIWWALEAHAVDAWPRIEAMLAKPEIWSARIFQEFLAARLMQRYAVTGSSETLRHCARLLEFSPTDQSTQQLMIGLNQAFQGRTLPPLPASLANALQQYQLAVGDAGLLLAIRQADQAAVSRAVAILGDSTADLAFQIEIANTFGEIQLAQSVPMLIRLATGAATTEPALQRVAIAALAQYDDEQDGAGSISSALVTAFGGQISAEHGLRATACRTLASRPHGALALLREVNQWRLRPDQVPTDVVQQLRTYQDPVLVAEVEQAFGPAITTTGPEQVAAIERLRAVVSQASGDPEAGRVHFDKRCASCHQLFGQGGKVGPPLDGYQRDDANFWIHAIVAPNLEIREGFQSYLAITVDGRSINGMIATADDQRLTLRNADNQTTVLSRDQIDKLQALPTSLMPADLLADMSDDQIRDLFAYLSFHGGTAQ
jgi:putative heme-binding domain-containing protein